MGRIVSKSLSSTIKTLTVVLLWGLPLVGYSQNTNQQDTVYSLIQRLDHEDWQVRAAAADTLGWKRDTTAVMPLIRALGDENPKVRAAAAKSFWSLEDPRATDPLIELLSDKDYGVISMAAFSLGRIGDTAAVKPLIGLLGIEDRDVRRNVIWALGDIKDARAVEHLIPFLDYDRSEGREFAQKALAEIGEPAVESVINACDHENPQTRLEALRTLLMISPTSEVFVKQCIKALEDPDSQVRGMAIFGLKRSGDTAAVEPLIKALNDEEERNRREAASALADFKNPRAIDALIEVLKNDTTYARSSASYALSKIGAPAVEPLLGLLDEEDRDIKIYAINSLGRIGDPQALKPLSKFLKHKDTRIRKSLVYALDGIDHPKCLKLLHNALNDEEYMVWYEACKVLAHKRDPSSVKPLVRTIGRTGESGYFCGNVEPGGASYALTKIGEPALKKLIKALNSNDPIVRSRAASVIGVICHSPRSHGYAPDWYIEDTTARSSRYFPKAIDALIETLNDKDHTVRKSAVSALGGIASPPQPRSMFLFRSPPQDTLPREEFPRIVDELVEVALKDDSLEVRLTALSSLRGINDDRALEQLILLLGDENEEVRKQAKYTIGAIGESAIEPLIEVLSDENPYMREGAANALGGIVAQTKDSAMVDLFIALTSDENLEIRRQALWVLLKIGDERAKDVMLDALRDEDQGVRRTAVRFMVKYPDPRAIDALMGIFVNDEKYRNTTSQALSKIGDYSTDSLMALLKHNDAGVRYWSLETLYKIGNTPPVEHLIELLKDENPRTRKLAAAILGFEGNNKAVGPLISILDEEKNIKVKESVVRSLAKIGDKRAVEPIILLLGHDSLQIRQRATKALGYFKDHRAVEPLIKALSDKGSYVARNARESLVQITGQNFGEDQQAWRAWWEENKEEYLK